jgi:hypothetical protein
MLTWLAAGDKSVTAYLAEATTAGCQKQSRRALRDIDVNG